MADQEGRDALFIPQDNRANFKQIIAKRSDLVRQDGGRLAPSTFGNTYYPGQVLGYATSGGDAGFYKPYASGNTDGSQVAVGVLADEASPDSSGNGSEISVIKFGVLFKDLCIGLDSGAISNMNAHSSVEHGVNLLSINC